MTTSAEVKEHDESGELTDSRNEIIPPSTHVQRIYKKFYCVTRDFGNKQLADEWAEYQGISATHFLSALTDSYESGWIDRAQRIESTRNAVIEECARHIEDRNEAFGNTFADEIRELLTKDKP